MCGRTFLRDSFKGIGSLCSGVFHFWLMEVLGSNVFVIVEEAQRCVQRKNFKIVWLLNYFIKIHLLGNDLSKINLSYFYKKILLFSKCI